MELLTIALTVVASLAGLGLLAITKGTDSRDTIGDDWARHASI